MSDPWNRLDPENPIDPETAARIALKAGQILRQAGLPRSYREDLERTLILVLLGRLARFDPGRGDRSAFVGLVLRRATINVLRHYRAAKRSAAVVSLETLVRAGADEPAELAARDDASGARERADAVLDVADAVAGLPADLRAVAEELRTHSAAEAARRLGVPRSTLHERVKEIRAAFEARGLDDYL